MVTFRRFFDKVRNRFAIWVPSMPMKFERDSDKLVIELQNTQPIELSDLTKSLNAISNQYRRFVIREDLHEESEAKLFVKEVKSGSAIFELFSYIQANYDQIGPVISTSKSVIEFGTYLKESFSKLKGGKHPDADLSPKDVRDLSDILEPTAKDPQGKLYIHADRGATVNVTMTLNNSDANTVQNQSAKLIETMRETDQKVYRKRAFYWDTTSKGEPRKTDRGVIETIERRAVPVIFDDAEIKGEMVAGKAHPFSTTYIVDVELIILRGRTKAYKITKLHDVIEDEDENGHNED